MENLHTFSMGKSVRLTGPKIPGDRGLFTPLKYDGEKVSWDYEIPMFFGGNP